MLVASPEDMVEWKEVDKHVVIFGEETLSDVADQDLDRSSAQQLGFHSRGFKGAYLSGQENRVQQFHNFIDRYIYDKLLKLSILICKNFIRLKVNFFRGKNGQNNKTSIRNRW